MSPSIPKKLKGAIGQYIISARHLRKWKPLWAYYFYVYCGEFFVLAAGIGLAAPVMNFLAPGSVKVSDPSGSTLLQYLHDHQALWAMGFLLIWGLFKFYIRHQELEKRCPLLLSCKRQFQSFEGELVTILQKDKPMEDLEKLQGKMSELVQRTIAEGGWMFPGFKEGIDIEVSNFADRLVAKFQEMWEDQPQEERIPGPNQALVV